jgi:predicted RNase H-like HicB family nuclease
MARLEEYTIVIRPDDNGTFVAYVPALPGCHAWGRTPEEARAELTNVFEMIREEYDFYTGEKIPEDLLVVL